MSFYFELTDDGMISLDIDIWVHQKFLFSMETENSEKRLIPIEHRRNVHQNEDPPFNSFLNVISCYKTKYLFQTTFLAQEATNGF
jgi:hypothetical protein